MRRSPYTTQSGHSLLAEAQDEPAVFKKFPLSAVSLKFESALGHGRTSEVSYSVTLKMANLAKAKDAKLRVLALRDAEVRHHEGP